MGNGHFDFAQCRPFRSAKVMDMKRPQLLQVLRNEELVGGNGRW